MGLRGQTQTQKGAAGNCLGGGVVNSENITKTDNGPRATRPTSVPNKGESKKRSGQACWPRRPLLVHQIYGLTKIFESNRCLGESHSKALRLRTWEHDALPTSTGDKCPRLVTLATTAQSLTPTLKNKIVRGEVSFLRNLTLSSTQSNNCSATSVLPPLTTCWRRRWWPANGAGATFFSGEPLPQKTKLQTLTLPILTSRSQIRSWKQQKVNPKPWIRNPNHTQKLKQRFSQTKPHKSPPQANENKKQLNINIQGQTLTLQMKLHGGDFKQLLWGFWWAHRGE